MGIKNETLEVLQHDYCLSKFAVNNKLLVNVEINRHHIDIDSVNCDYIIQIKRSKSEKNLSDKISTIQGAEISLPCIFNGYRNGKVFDHSIALQALNKLELSSETKEAEINRISEKIADFAMETFSCVLSTTIE